MVKLRMCLAASCVYFLVCLLKSGGGELLSIKCGITLLFFSNANNPKPNRNKIQESIQNYYSSVVLQSFLVLILQQIHIVGRSCHVVFNNVKLFVLKINRLFLLQGHGPKIV
mmetsp:Transcript_905/g.1007  ORF Transcript_905/g.1007 Transcript_905/m.1007 type:complete len:112 (-) Transcript_905:949-1284(-)